MNSLRLKLERIKEFESNSKRRLLGLMGVLLAICTCTIILLDGDWSGVKIALGVAVLIQLPEFFKMAKNDFKSERIPVGECDLEFGESELVCRFNNKINWRIPFSKLSHVETLEIGSGKWFAPRIKETHIYTNRGHKDSYPLPGAIKPEDERLVQANILAAKNLSNS